MSASSGRQVDTEKSRRTVRVERGRRRPIRKYNYIKSDGRVMIGMDRRSTDDYDPKRHGFLHQGRGARLRA